MIRFLKAVGRMLLTGIGVIAVVVLLMLAVYGVRESLYQRSIPMGEVISPDEDRVMAEAIAMALTMINATRDQLIEEGVKGDSDVPGKGGDAPVIYRRDVHIKSHGCVKANFTVLDVERKYRWGVFREPRTYQAWIRYSNGDYRLHPDSTPDARGMAIKLMDVPGRKLLPGQEKARTQDFVMMNSTVYFIRRLEDYVELTKFLAVGDNTGYFLNDWSLNPLSYRYRELWLVLGTKKRAPETPLTERYFSASAYALGPDQYIKFSARPKACGEGAGKPDQLDRIKGYNFLRLRMAEQLKQAPACFDFMVQLQVPGEIMPVEDATIEWEERVSPFVPVAHIEIPKQEFDTDAQNRFCENLSFNPWHALPEHRPVGVFNRVRKALYEEVAKYRRDQNRRIFCDASAPPLRAGQPAEPDSWRIDGSDADCPPSL